MNLWVHGRENENSSWFLPYSFEHLPDHHMHTTLSTVQSAICQCPKPFGNVELSPDFIWFPGIRCVCLFKKSAQFSTWFKTFSFSRITAQDPLYPYAHITNNLFPHKIEPWTMLQCCYIVVSWNLSFNLLPTQQSKNTIEKWLFFVHDNNNWHSKWKLSQASHTSKFKLSFHKWAWK